jgi:succinylglutamate desuccinylase
MTAQQGLFGSSSDWLEHSLAHAGEECQEASTKLADGTHAIRRAVGVLELAPAIGPSRSGGDAQGNDVLIISAGVHGNETAPVEVLNGLVNELLRGQWSLACPALLILGNPPAMVAAERFIDANMNRLFHGAHEQQTYHGFPEAVRARQLEVFCQQFATAHAGALSHYDLHTAIRPSRREKFALYPFVANRRVPENQCHFLLEAQVNTLLLQHKAGTTFSSFTSSALKAESFTIELGKVQPFGQNDLSRFEGIENALRRRLQGEGLASKHRHPSTDRLAVFEVVHEILNTGKNFQLHIPDDAANFTEYSPGTLIWEDSETCYRVGDVPEAVVFPNRKVPTGQRAGLMIRQKQAQPPSS